jgi:hypothetical protein
MQIRFIMNSIKDLNHEISLANPSEAKKTLYLRKFILRRSPTFWGIGFQNQSRNQVDHTYASNAYMHAWHEFVPLKFVTTLQLCPLRMVHASPSIQHIHPCVCMYVCMHVCMYVCMCTLHGPMLGNCSYTAFNTKREKNCWFFQLQHRYKLIRSILEHVMQSCHLRSQKSRNQGGILKVALISYI